MNIAPPPPSLVIATSNVVTMKLQLAVLPLVSVATHVTVVNPAGKLDPLGGVQTVVITAQLSDEVGAG